jgi:hypothetical protein
MDLQIVFAELDGALVFLFLVFDVGRDFLQITGMTIKIVSISM